MPIVASHASEIRRRVSELADPKRRAGAILRLRTLGARVPPHIEDDLARLKPEVRTALMEVLRDVDTADARAILRRLGGPPAAAASSEALTRRASRAVAEPDPTDAEADALNQLRALPPPRAGESASVSRRRGEAHLLLARTGSRLARKDLLTCLVVLGADRGRVYCEAAGLIGDAYFLPVLAGMATRNPECGAYEAIDAIAARDKLSTRSKALKRLDPARTTRSISERSGRTST